MRVANHILIRNVLLFYFDQNKTAADAFRDLNETYGEGTISRRQCFEWFARFREGDRSPANSPTEAPTDYHVNRSVSNWQAGKFFDDLDHMLDDLNAWMASKNSEWFARGINLLPQKWQAS